jgi:ribosomal protein S18 acetylase RimI-like enzyme
MKSMDGDAEALVQPMKFDGDYREEQTLADGAKVTLRMIRLEDGPTLRESFASLSPLSRYRRFFGGVTELTDYMVRYLTEVDGKKHVAIVATTDSLDLKTEVGLGVARFIRLEAEPDVAEAAITVIDTAQGRGIGRLLLHALVEAAQERSIRAIRAEVLATNTPMRRLLDDIGAVVRSNDGTTLVFDVPLEWPAPGAAPGVAEEGQLLPEAKEHPLRRVLHAVAESFAALRGGGGAKED